MNRAAIYDGICNVQRELDNTATRINEYPGRVVRRRLEDSATLITTMAAQIADQGLEAPSIGNLDEALSLTSQLSHELSHIPILKLGPAVANCVKDAILQANSVRNALETAIALDDQLHPEET